MFSLFNTVKKDNSMKSKRFVKTFAERLNENRSSKLNFRNKLRRDAGFTAVRGGNEEPFDQKRAFDDSKHATQDGLKDMFKRLSKDPAAVDAFIKKIKRHTSLEDIAQYMQDSLTSDGGNTEYDYLSTFGDDYNGVGWFDQNDRNSTNQAEDYGDEEEISDWEAYSKSKYTNSNFDGPNGESMFNSYKDEHGPMRVRRRRN